jgi:hypothetical protein
MRRRSGGAPGRATLWQHAGSSRERLGSAAAIWLCGALESGDYTVFVSSWGTSPSRRTYSHS